MIRTRNNNNNNNNGNNDTQYLHNDMTAIINNSIDNINNTQQWQ